MSADFDPIDLRPGHRRDGAVRVHGIYARLVRQVRDVPTTTRSNKKTPAPNGVYDAPADIETILAPLDHCPHEPCVQEAPDESAC